MSRRPPLLHVAAGVGAFLLVAAAWRAAACWPNEFGLEDKLRHLAGHGQEVELLVVGSSHVLCSVIPDALDAGLAAAGRPLRSFNLGAAGMDAALAEALLREVVPRLPRLSVVVLEWLPPLPEAAGGFTRREVAAHSLPVLRSMLAAVAEAPALSAGERVARAARHVHAWLRRSVAYGEGPAAVACRLGSGSGRPFLDEAELRAGRGYRPRWVLPSDEARRAELVGDREHERRVAGLSAALESPPPVPEDELAAVAAAHARVERFLAGHGVTLVVLLPAGMSAHAAPRALAARGTLPRLVALDDPASHPALFALGSRADRVHLSRAGADLFSGLLAAELAARLPR